MIPQLLTFVTLVAAPDSIGPRAIVPPIDPPAAVAQDTTHRRRPHAVEISDWYARRLAVHRAVSYAILPVFAAQYVAGERLFRDGSAAPTWAKTGHRVGATTLAGMFTVNTVTGLWNLWDSRSVDDHRALRTTHALMMLTADAAFTWAGVALSDQAENSLAKRKLHRTVALSATGLTVASAAVMKIFNK